MDVSASRESLHQTLDYVIVRVQYLSEKALELQNESISVLAHLILREDCIECCKAVQMLFVEKLLSDPLTSTQGKILYGQQLEMVLKFITFLRDTNRFPEECLLWVICVLVNLRGMLPLDDILAGVVMDHANDLCRSLSSEAHEYVLNMAIHELWNFCREDKNEICLNLGYALVISDSETKKQFSVKPFAICIDDVNPEESKSAVLMSILLLISDKTFDYLALPESSVGLICEVLLNVIDNYHLSYLCISLMHKMLNLNLLCDIYFIGFLDCMIGFLELCTEQIGDIPPPTIPNQDSILLSIFAALNKVNTLIKFKGHNAANYQNATFKSLFPFTRRLLSVVQGGDVNNMAPTIFVCRCLEYFTLGDEWFARELGEPVALLMRNLVMRFETKNEIPLLLTSLFGFLATLYGEEHAVGVVDSIVKEVDQFGNKSLYVRQVFISGLGAIPSAAEFLNSIVPNEEHLLCIFEELKLTTSHRLERLTMAMSIVSELCHYYTGSPDTLISFLSLPWICDIDWSSWEHFQKSFPLLCPVKDREEDLKTLLSEPVNLKKRSIKALSRMPYKNEWRTMIIKFALKLPAGDVLVSTLDALPLFCTSLPSFQFFDEIDFMLADYSKKTMDLDEDLQVVCALFRTIADCLCVRSKGIQFIKTKIKCAVCDDKKGKRQTVVVAIPPSFLALCRKAVEVDPTEQEIKFDFVGVICAVFRHVKDMLDLKEELITISLPFFLYGEPVSLIYMNAVAEFVKSGLPESYVFMLQDCIFSLPEEETQIDYFVCCAEHSTGDTFGYECLVEVIAMGCIRTVRNTKILNKTRNIINVVSQREGIRPKTLFLRHANMISRRLADVLMEAVQYVMDDTSIEDYERDVCLRAVVECCMCSLSTVFSLNRTDDPTDVLRAWLEVGLPHIVPHFFLSQQNFTTAAEFILKHMVSILSIPQKELVTQTLPHIFFVVAGVRKLQWNNVLVKRIEQFSGVTFDTLVRYESFKITSSLILCLGFHENSSVIHLMKVLNYIDCEINYSITEVVKPYYLGILLSIRRAFADDLYYEYREVIIGSVIKLITMLDETFLNQSPSKMFAVLRVALPKGETVLDAWCCLLQKLNMDVLKSKLHSILFAVAPLNSLPGSSKVFSIVQNVRAESDSTSDACMRFDRAVEVLHCPESPLLYLLPPNTVRSNEDPLRSCAKMLVEETSDTHILVLPRMLTLIDVNVKDCIKREVIESLLSALKCNSCEETRKLIALCLGQCGAVDPGRLGMEALRDSSRQSDFSEQDLYFIDDLQHFFKDVLKICVRCFMECADAENVDFIAFAIQEILIELGTHDQMSDIVMNSLEPWVRNEVMPFCSTSFKPSLHQRLFEDVKPLISRSQNYDEWLSRWYYTASDRIKESRNGKIFKTLQYIFFTGSARLAQDLIAKVVLQAILEDNEVVLVDAILEIKSVFELALADGFEWIRMATHTCFKMIEFIEKYLIFRVNQDIDPANLAVRPRIQKFLKDVLSIRQNDTNTLLAVDIAEKYNSSCRALQWQELYGLQHSPKCEPQFNRDAFYVLEKLYRQVGDTDNVMGSFNCIVQRTNARSCEQTVAFEAIGNYTAALPLYQQKPLQAVPLVRCFLELNQPVTAFTIASMFIETTRDDDQYRQLRDCQYEAACRHGDWEFLTKCLAEDEGCCVSWGAQIAAVLSSIKTQDEDTFEIRIERARTDAITALQALTLEDIDTYSQCYNYVQRLHILSEIDDAVTSLDLFDDESEVSVDEMQKLVGRWNVRSENAIQCRSVLEPIYAARSAILKMTTPPVSRNYACQYMLESSKLSRQAGHLSTAWTHLVEARNLQIVDDICIDIEESRYLFRNNQIGDAISLLQNSLKKHFPDLVKEMDKKKTTREEISFVSHLSKVAKERLATPVPNQQAFIEGQLQLTEFMEKANTANAYDIYQRYCFLDHLSMDSEHQSYKFALFFENSFYFNNENNYDTVKYLIYLYRRVLASGKRYILHVMPRMLTIWLDYSCIDDNIEEEQQVMAIKRRRKTAKSDDSSRIQKVTEMILTAFNSLDHFYFYTAYPQLIARLCIPVESAYLALESIMVQLMIEYPHECMWQTIASLRGDVKSQGVRITRTKRIFQSVAKKGKTINHPLNFEKLLHHYDFVAKELINVANPNEKRDLAGRHSNFNQKYKKLSSFFADPQVKISIPFITMVDKRLPTFHASQIALPNNEVDDMIYITGFEDCFDVYSSLEMPKRITMIGSNGKRYPLIAKAKDELRKDARCEDLFRTINILLLRDSAARQRQLHIRTYSVIPLQSNGGILEFVNDLIPFRSAVGPKTALETHLQGAWHKEHKDSPERAKICKKLIESSEVRMAKWFRDTYPDPCKWYAARTAFTRTAATMSMVGFIMGLGDRHCENILIDKNTGDCVHVDFNCIFNRSDYLPVPEHVPFRLTQNMLSAFGPNGVEGCFRGACEIVMRILHEETSTLFTVLETFLHDPLLEWNRIENRNHQMRGQKAVEPDMGTERNELALIRARLEGKIVTSMLYPLTKSSAALSVEGQVNQLINMATDNSILERMYLGWLPHY